MSPPNKRPQFSDDEENASSSKLIQPKHHIPKKRKVQIIIPPIASQPEKQNEVISLLSSDEDEEDEEDEEDKNEENTPIDENVQTEHEPIKSTRLPKEADVTEPSTQPILITLDDSDGDDDNDMMDIEDQETSSNYSVVRDAANELVSDNNDDDDAYFHRSDPISKESIYLIDNNTQRGGTSQKTYTLPSSISKLPSSPIAQQKESGSNPVPSSKDNAQSESPQHHEPEFEPPQHEQDSDQEQSEQEPEQHYKQESQISPIVDTPLELHGKSKEMSEYDIHSKFQSTADHETSRIKDHEAPGFPSRSEGDELKDLSNDNTLIGLPESTPESLHTPLSSLNDAHRLKKGNTKLVTISKSSNSLLVRFKKNKPKRVTFASDVYMPMDADSADEEREEDKNITTDQPLSLNPTTTTLSEEEEDLMEEEEDVLYPPTIGTDSNGNDEDSTSNNEDITLPPHSDEYIGMISEVPDTKRNITNQDNFENNQNTSTDSEYDTAEEEYVSDIPGTDTTSLGNENIQEENMVKSGTLSEPLATDGDDTTSRANEGESEEGVIAVDNASPEQPSTASSSSNFRVKRDETSTSSSSRDDHILMTGSNTELHLPGRRASIIPVNSGTHVDVNAVVNTIQVEPFSRAIQRRLQKTGYTYDSAMSYHARLDRSEIHPEDPHRIFKIFNILRERGLLSECKRINSRKATKQEILLVHNILLYRTMRDIRDYETRSDYHLAENRYDSIYLNSNSFNSGLYAVGCLIELAEAVALNQIRNGFAIIRPPGHHAESDTSMGFCMFNNVAIATKHCMKYLGVKRVLIIDWDVHFGNGTQEIFSDQADVLYISLHRYEDAAFYPSDRKGSAQYTGHGKGRGRTVNIPWPCSGMTDADYLYAFRQVVIPIATEFNPDLVIVSAGFDAAINDPIGLCKVTPAGYGQMTHMLKSLAHGKLVIALEGGYDLNSITVSALACMEILLGEAPDPIDPTLQPRNECLEVIKVVKRVQSRHWDCCNI